MINTIRSTRRLPPADVIEMLFACHDRIRRLTRLAERLPTAHLSPAAEVAEAARSLLAYFTSALPMHVADEDLTIRPRLHEASVPEVVREAMASMSEQHEQLDKLISLLVPRWEVLAADGARLRIMPADFIGHSSSLRQKMDAHLGLEEETIFPAMRRYLSQSTEDVILREMRERRSRNGHGMLLAEEVGS